MIQRMGKEGKRGRAGYSLSLQLLSVLTGHIQITGNISAEIEVFPRDLTVPSLSGFN